MRAFGFVVLFVLLWFVVTGCASGVPVSDLTPQQRVEASAFRYAQLTATAKVYSEQPFCDMSDPPCADRETVIWLDEKLPLIRDQLDGARESARLGSFEPMIESNIDNLTRMLNRRLQ